MNLDQKIEELEEAAMEARKASTSVSRTGDGWTNRVSEGDAQTGAVVEALRCGMLETQLLNCAAVLGGAALVARALQGDREAVALDREAASSTRVDVMKDIVQEWRGGRLTYEHAMQLVVDEVDG